MPCIPSRQIPRSLKLFLIIYSLTHWRYRRSNQSSTFKRKCLHSKLGIRVERRKNCLLFPNHCNLCPLLQTFILYVEFFAVRLWWSFLGESMAQGQNKIKLLVQKNSWKIRNRKQNLHVRCLICKWRRRQMTRATWSLLLYLESRVNYSTHHPLLVKQTFYPLPLWKYIINLHPSFC